MNIMIVSNNPKQTSEDLSILDNMQPTNQLYFPIVILEAESALSPLFDLGLHADPNRHTIIITDNPNKLWQGAREELLDMIIEIKNEEAEKWLAKMFGEYSC
ncbi:MAG TPA: hypothetical protein VMW00_01535 [Dehalococcoidales bacterium]|nr:hypothetical protein [Dehalococcoidales bacterium]